MAPYTSVRRVVSVSTCEMSTSSESRAYLAKERVRLVIYRLALRAVPLLPGRSLSWCAEKMDSRHQTIRSSSVSGMSSMLS